MMKKGLIGSIVSLFLLPVISLAAAYGTYIGGENGDSGQYIAVDSAGYIYLTGYTYSTGMPVTAGAVQPAYNNGYNSYIQDVFVAKFSPDLSSLIFCTYFGGSGANYPMGMKVDNDGNVYIAGYTASTNLPVTSGAFQTTFNGGPDDGFIAKLNPTGTSLLYCTYLGGNNTDRVHDIALDSAGNIYLTGLTQSSNFPISATAKQKGYTQWEGFISKLNPSGTGIVYSTYIGGSAYDYGMGIDVDKNGIAVVVGNTRSTNLPVTSGAKQPTNAGGNYDAFVVKVNADGSDWLYCTYLGGSGSDQGLKILLDTTGAAYVLATGDSTDYPVTTLAYQTTNHGSYDAMVTRVNADGTDWIYSTYLGGGGMEYTQNMSISSQGKICISGYTPSGDFPVTPDALYPTRPASYSGFVGVLDDSLSTLLMGTYLGGNTWEQLYGSAFDTSERLVVCGQSYGKNFPVTAGAFDTTLWGSYDAFVYKFDEAIVPIELSDFCSE
jgi:hypothetical protein